MQLTAEAMLGKIVTSRVLVQKTVDPILWVYFYDMFASTQILPFLSPLFGTKAVFAANVVWLANLLHQSILTWHSVCYVVTTWRRGIKYASYRYISLLFTQVGKKRTRFYAHPVHIYKKFWVLMLWLEIFIIGQPFACKLSICSCRQSLAKSDSINPNCPLSLFRWENGFQHAESGWNRDCCFYGLHQNSATVWWWWC